jgi:hypothetical protein
MEAGRNRGIEALKNLAAPLTRLGENLAVAGHQRLRDTGIPALVELADLVKLQGTDAGSDAGYLPASRLERTSRMNDLGDKLGHFEADVIDAAREALQTGRSGPPNTWGTPESRLQAREAVKAIKAALQDMRKYMVDAGVLMGDLGPDYFPRVYNPEYISRNQAAFLSVLASHGVQNPEATMQKIIGADGTEFTIEVDRPGMQHAKERSLAFIPDSELAPFMLKDTWQLLNSYVTQGTRRAEWARRFGEEDFSVGPADREPTRLQELLGEARRRVPTTATSTRPATTCAPWTARWATRSRRSAPRARSGCRWSPARTARSPISPKPRRLPPVIRSRSANSPSSAMARRSRWGRLKALSRRCSMPPPANCSARTWSAPK